MEEFARYGFNKSHAAGYSIVAYQTAYLKAHYPAEFMAASLSSEIRNSDRIMILLDESKRLGIQILPPDVNKSHGDFTVTENSIRFGLGAVKNVGKGPIESIIRARKKQGSFHTIFDLVKDVDLRTVNKKVLESLTKAGALDSFEGHRAQLFHSLEKANNFAQQFQAETQRGQFSIFNAPAYERELLGFYVTGHPLAKFKDEIYAFSTIKLNDLQALHDGNNVKVGGIITNIKTIFDQGGRKMAFFSLEDFSGSAEVLAFSSVYEKHQNLINKDSLVFITGRVSIQEDKEPKIICEDLFPLHEIRRKFTRNICMNFSLDDIKINNLNEIKKIVKANEGKCQLLIHVANGDKKEYVIRSKKFKVAPNETLLKGIKELIGDENVWIEGEVTK
jgi:DNA polymerase-3 subunit alpha